MLELHAIHLLIVGTPSDREPGHWKPHDNDSTLSQYAVPATALLTAILRSLHNDPSGYQFPLTDSQRSTANRLYISLEAQQDITPFTIHKLLYGLAAVPTTESSSDQWKSPLMCWLAISGLRSGGRFLPAHEYTRVLAKWEYLLRNLHFYEALVHKDEYEDHLYG